MLLSELITFYFRLLAHRFAYLFPQLCDIFNLLSFSDVFSTIPKSVSILWSFCFYPIATLWDCLSNVFIWVLRWFVLWFWVRVLMFDWVVLNFVADVWFQCFTLKGFIFYWVDDFFLLKIGILSEIVIFWVSRVLLAVPLFYS